MSDYEFIVAETHQNVGLVRINRPQAMNALNSEVMTELNVALQAFDANPQIGAMVVTGNERAFAAGADIKEMKDASAVEMWQRNHLKLWDLIGKIKKPLIAAVAGYCLGGGNELAMSCDMLIAAEGAKFGQPEITLGVIPGAGGTQRLTKAVGKTIAMEMVLNNRTLSATEALHYGLVNRIVPDERYLEEALTFAQEIAERAPLALQMGKEMVNKAYETLLAEGMEDERRAFYYLFSSDDQKEGMAAFAEKRKPDWTGK